MNELTELERNAIYLVRALANAEKLSKKQRAIITLIGQDYIIETELGSVTLKRFFGKFYRT